MFCDELVEELNLYENVGRDEMFLKKILNLNLFDVVCYLK